MPSPLEVAHGRAQGLRAAERRQAALDRLVEVYPAVRRIEASYRQWAQCVDGLQAAVACADDGEKLDAWALDSLRENFEDASRDLVSGAGRGVPARNFGVGL